MNIEKLQQRRNSDSWQAMVTPHLLIEKVRSIATERKWALMGCALGRIWEVRFTDQNISHLLALSERHADSPVSEEELLTTVRSLRDYALGAQTSSDQKRCISAILRTITKERSGWDKEQLDRLPASRSLLCNLIRDIFGNPFRPVAFDPRWRSEATVALARTAYDTRDFSLLPILADALEEAGCDHPDVLNHCRDPNGVHVRGCWVVDGCWGRSSRAFSLT